ncbi:hypothetical protein [Thiomonas sp. 13-64-67]|uniref:hypothetical protein n=1 Tax=Thiomonas sp. 13-64-67 TaxID=1970447 RepID=UPI002579A2F7|nr:hypothetical protein [Thiomonas sp. 13-64-67]
MTTDRRTRGWPGWRTIALLALGVVALHLAALDWLGAAFRPLAAGKLPEPIYTQLLKPTHQGETATGATGCTHACSQARSRHRPPPPSRNRRLPCSGSPGPGGSPQRATAAHIGAASGRRDQPG